jgi:hypothetical protein
MSLNFRVPRSTFDGEKLLRTLDIKRSTIWMSFPCMDAAIACASETSRARGRK